MDTPRRRRTRYLQPQVVGALVSIIVATLLAACGGSGGGTVTSLPKDLRILTTSGPPTFDQWATVAQPLGIIMMVNEPLVRFDGAEFQPAVAESFETVTPTQYTYTLREGVTFSDGTALTGEDVKFSLEQGMDDSHYSTTHVVLSSIKDIAVSGNVVTVNLKAPEPQFQYVVAQTGIVSKAFYAKHGDAVGTPDVGQLGSGPYTLASFSPEEEMVVERNPDYWGEPAPFDSITFAVTKDDSARMLELQSGEADGIFETPINQVDPIDKLDGYTMHEVADTTLYILQMDATKAPFNDPGVRDAIRHAIDRKAIVDAAFGGKGVVASTLTSAAALESIADPTAVDDALAGFDKANAYDAKVAKADLAGSKSPKGFEVELPIETIDPNVTLISQVVEQDLAKIGIKVKVKVRDADYSAVLLEHDHQGLTLNSFSTNTPDPAMPLGYFTPADGVFNLTGLDNRSAVTALDKSNRLAVDDPARGDLILEALTAQQESGAILPLALPNMYFGLRDGLNPEGFTNYWWMARWDEGVSVQ